MFVLFVVYVAFNLLNYTLNPEFRHHSQPSHPKSERIPGATSEFLYHLTAYMYLLYSLVLHFYIRLRPKLDTFRYTLGSCSLKLKLQSVHNDPASKRTII
jgi:type II secretory pathway component PulF